MQQRNFYGYALASIIILSPFANLIHAIYPVYFLGKSFYVVIQLALLVLTWLHFSSKEKDNFSQTSIAIIFFLTIITLVGLLKYLLQDKNFNILNSLYIFIPLIVYSLGVEIKKNHLLAKNVLQYICISGYLVGALRVINHLFFPQIRLDEETGTIIFDGYSTRDMLLGSSISASLIVVSMYSLFVRNRLGWVKNQALHTILMILLFYSTLNSASRSPILAALIVLTLSLKQIFKSGLRLPFVVFLFFGLMYSIFSDIDLINLSFIDRLDEESGRIDKLVATFYIIFNSTTDFLIGGSDDLILNTVVGGQIISDNSFGLLATSFGAPFALVYALILSLVFFAGLKFNQLAVFFFFILLSQLALTNSILWVPWVINGFLLFAIIKSPDKLRSVA